MCFQLYAGTAKPIPRSEFDEDAPYLHVASLTDDEAAIKTHFSSPEVQYIGSTSCCGCDFPHAIFQNGGWPEIDYQKSCDRDPEREATHRDNLDALVALLRETGEKTIELYGVWAGFAVEPEAREDITIETLLSPGFHFKERCFYRVVTIASPKPMHRKSP